MSLNDLFFSRFYSVLFLSVKTEMASVLVFCFLWGLIDLRRDYSVQIYSSLKKAAFEA